MGIFDTSLNELRNEARSKLHLTAEIIQKTGRDLDVGEEFTVRFSVSNRFSGSNGESPGHAHYENVTLEMRRTRYAEPKEGEGKPVKKLLARHLGYGHTVTADVVFLARAKRPDIDLGFITVDLPEPYVDARVDADFDIVKFFHIVQKETFVTQIDVG